MYICIYSIFTETKICLLSPTHTTSFPSQTIIFNNNIIEHLLYACAVLEKFKCINLFTHNNNEVDLSPMKLSTEWEVIGRRLKG